MPRHWAVVVAGGTGARFGAAKQFSLLAGRPVVSWSLDACRAGADGVVLVVPAGHEHDGFAATLVVTGGATRSESVRAGLAALPTHCEVVVIHDAARPLAPPALFGAVLAPLDDPAVDGVICALALSDTVKRVEPPLDDAPTGGARVFETLDRRQLVAVQTPQAFRTKVLREAHALGADATDDAALLEALGATVRVVKGDPRNIKITTPVDLALAEHLVSS